MELAQGHMHLAVHMAKSWPPLRHFFPGRARRRNGGGGGARGDRGAEMGAVPPEGASRGRRLVPRFENRHSFSILGGHILCTRCLGRARSWGGAVRRMATEACAGESPVIREAFDSQDFGHTLALGIYNGRPTVICIGCGRYATARVEGLSSRCAPPGTRGKYAISRFFRGLHPDQRRRDSVHCEAFFRVLGAELQEFIPQG